MISSIQILRAWVIGASIASAVFAEEAAQMNPIFAFKNSMESGGPADVNEQVKVLSDLGFDGFDNRDLQDLDATLKALDAHEMRLFSVYFTVRIDPGEVPFNEKLAESLPLLKDRGTVLWCNTHSKQFKPSDEAGDALAVPIFQQLADLAAPYGVRIAPYPHIGLWVESPEDTARLAAKVKRPNFGTSFNLYHWKALGERKRPLAEVARELAPNLMLLSINGDTGPHDIGPLETADIDEYFTVLKTFRDAGYNGPVGLQCYLIPGDPRTHLGRSMGVWKELTSRLRAKSDSRP